MSAVPHPSSPAGTFADELADYIDREVSAGGETVRPDTDLVTSGLVDSLGIILVVDWLERRLAIRIDPADVVLEYFESVQSMVTYLRSRGDCAVD